MYGEKSTAQITEDWFLRVFIVLYLILGHIGLIVLWPSGIKVEMINSEPWPYKRLFGGLWRGFDEQ